MIIFHQAKDGADKNLVDADLVIGQVADTLGTTTPGDGGAATYLVEAPRAADEVIDYTLANGNVAARVNGGGSYDPLGTLAVTVGGGGDYATLAAAIEALSARGVKYTHAVTINILTGHTLDDTLVVNGVDLGWITITADDATVNWDTSGFTSADSFLHVTDGGTGPVLAIKLAATGTGVGVASGLQASGAGSAINMRAGNGISNLGACLYANDGGQITATGCTFASTATGGTGAVLALASGQSSIIAYNCGFNGASKAVEAFDGSMVNCSSSGIDSLTQGGEGILASLGGVVVCNETSIVNYTYPVRAIRGGTVNCYSLEAVKGTFGDIALNTETGGTILASNIFNVSGAFNQIANANDGSYILCDGANGTSATGTAYQVSTGSTVSAGSGTLSQTANTITADGIIYQ